MTTNIHEFVKDALRAGASRKEVADALKKAGWQDDEIKNALNAYADIKFPVPVPMRGTYISAQETFFYLLLFLTLYISSISLGTLLFQYINYWLPDVLENPYGTRPEYIFDIIRQAASSVIIAFPVFIFITLKLRKGIAKDPDKRASKIRKWLTYITLFIAAGIIIGDLITLVFNLLKGDLTLRFVLKIATVGTIAGTIFGYYLTDMRRDEKVAKKPARMTVFGMIISAMTLIVVATGLFLSGPPSTERLRRLDEQRTQSLQQIRFIVIDEFYRVNGRLPESIDEAQSSTQLEGVTFFDPQTQQPFEYQKTSSSTYILCAVFSLASQQDAVKYDQSWAHSEGHNCFPFDMRSSSVTPNPSYSYPLPPEKLKQ